LSKPLSATIEMENMAECVFSSILFGFRNEGMMQNCIKLTGFLIHPKWMVFWMVRRGKTVL